MTFEKTGVVKVGCNIHDWMKGVVLVLPPLKGVPDDWEPAHTITEK